MRTARIAGVLRQHNRLEERLPAALPWRRDDAKLLHQAEHVDLCPLLRQLAVGHTIDRNTRHHHRSAGRRNAESLTLVGTARGSAHHQLVPFGNQVVNDPL
jgi:hypothetical protein